MASKAKRYILAGEYLRRCRKEKSLTHRELAEAVGFKHYTTISNIEAGRQRLTFKHARQYADALGVELFDLTRFLLSDYEPKLYELLFIKCEIKPSPTCIKQLR